jgi:hypothetical protein
MPFVKHFCRNYNLRIYEEKGLRGGRRTTVHIWDGQPEEAGFFGRWNQRFKRVTWEMK